MDYSVYVYNQIPDIQSVLSAIGIWSRSRFDPVSETFSNFYAWGCPTYVLEPKLQKHGVKIPKWDPCSIRGVNMVLSNKHSRQVGLVLNFSTGSVSPHYHVVSDDMFYTVARSTAADPEVWIRKVTSSKSIIQVMLDQEDDP